MAKYTEIQKFRRNHSKMYKHNQKQPAKIVSVKIENGFYIVESKLNSPD